MFRPCVAGSSGRRQLVVSPHACGNATGIRLGYAFTLAQHFSRFYHGYPILQANDEHDRALRVLVAYAFQRRLSTLLHLLGIPLPKRM